MFYGVQILGKKRPLSTVWLLGCGRRFSRRKIMKENILQSCEMIMQPVVPLALRLSAILMSGVIMCFHQKQQYILNDFHQAMRSVTNKFSRQSESKVKKERTLSVSHQMKSASKRNEDDTTIRYEDEVDVMSKHAEEIFMQEFLSTQSVSPGISASVERKSMDSPGMIGSRENSLLVGRGSSISFDSKASYGNYDIMDQSNSMEEATFMQEPDESITMVGTRDEIMKDLFAVDGQQNQPVAQTQNEQNVSFQEEEEERVNEQVPSEEVTVQKKARKSRKRSSRIPYVFEKEITLSRETIRNWLNDVTDIVCDRPFLTTSRLNSKRIKLDIQYEKSAVMTNACSELMALFQKEPPLDREKDNEDSGEIEIETLRQEEKSSMSPVAVSDVAFHSSSSGEDIGQGMISDIPDGDRIQTESPQMLPPTDEFILPETDEASLMPRLSLERQYNNMSFTPLRSETQDQVLGTQPSFEPSATAERVLTFFAEEAMKTGGAFGFVELMKSNAIGRSDVAKVFFYSLVLQSKGLIEMTQNVSLEINVSLPV